MNHESLHPRKRISIFYAEIGDNRYACDVLITKQVYPYMLRHSLPHTLEQGTNLKIVKELIEYNNVKPIEMYSSTDMANVMFCAE